MDSSAEKRNTPASPASQWEPRINLLSRPDGGGEDPLSTHSQEIDLEGALNGTRSGLQISFQNWKAARRLDLDRGTVVGPTKNPPFVLLVGVPIALKS